MQVYDGSHLVMTEAWVLDTKTGTVIWNWPLTREQREVGQRTLRTFGVVIDFEILRLKDRRGG